MKVKLSSLRLAGLIGLLTAGMVWFGSSACPVAQAASASQIDSNVSSTLDIFKTDVKGAKDVLAKAKGLLVFPRVYQGGIVIGGQYGEGALQVNGKTVDYYKLVSGSYGFQLGGQRKSMILAFMTDEALANFQKSSGWTVGADASVAIVTVGAEGKIDSATLNKPILAFVVDQKGLMYQLTLNGTKISKIQK